MSRIMWERVSLLRYIDKIVTYTYHFKCNLPVIKIVELISNDKTIISTLLKKQLSFT